MILQLTRLQALYLKSLLEIEIGRQTDNPNRIMQVAIEEFKKVLEAIEDILEGQDNEQEICSHR